jgi:uncharacterized membrane protein YgdD (TMEM256/DUF423 family)
MQRTWIGLGALAGLGAVAMAAVAAHALPANADPHTAEILRSAIQMQGWHALALLACGLWAGRAGRLAARLTNCAGAAFAAGLLLFCGALYALALADIHPPMIAPIGGSLLMLGWALLAASALPAR